MSAISSTRSASVTAPCQCDCQRAIGDADYGREEYIQDCVQRVCKGEKVLVTLGGYWTASNLMPILQEKFGSSGSVWFPGFKSAKEEVVAKVEALGKRVAISEFRGGSSSDMLGIPDGLDGHFISVL